MNDHVQHFVEGWRLFREDLKERIPIDLTFAIAVLALAIALLVATGWHLGA